VDRTLTEDVLEYQSSRHGLEPLIERLALFVYRYPRMHLGWNEDDCGEFFCEFYPKLRRLVERFEYHGKPFEVYLIVTLKWQLRTYAGRKAAENLQLRVLAQENFWTCDRSSETQHEEALSALDIDDPAELEIPPCICSLLKIDHRKRITDPSTKKRFLILALMSAVRLTESLIARIAYLTGYDPDWIHGLIEELRSRVQTRRSRLLHLAQKRNGCFFRVYCLQEQLRLVAEDHLRRELCRQIAHEELRLTNTLEEISRLPLAPTHRDVAEVLGVPKGTVDSGLYYLKESLTALSY